MCPLSMKLSDMFDQSPSYFCKIVVTTNSNKNALKCQLKKPRKQNTSNFITNVGGTTNTYEAQSSNMITICTKSAI